MDLDYKIVIEKPEFEEYNKHVDSKKILILPFVNQGLVASRNWIWDHAQKNGFEKYWTLDDNIREVYRLNRNRRIRVGSGVVFKILEDFGARFLNMPILGMHYKMFAPRGLNKPPFITNTRVYSNMLITTDYKDRYGLPYRFRDFYNDDTDLCLRMLKDGNCLIQTYAFLIDKSTTMKVKGGNTGCYQDDGRYKMALSLRNQHPDVTAIVERYGRWQHFVNYDRFRNNKLMRSSVAIANGINEYGLKLKPRKK